MGDRCPSLVLSNDLRRQGCEKRACRCFLHKPAPISTQPPPDGCKNIVAFSIPLLRLLWVHQQLCFSLAMDPLSAIASVTGLLAAIAKVSTTVNGIAKKMGNAPDSIHSLVNEISDLSVCLVQLQPFVRGTQSPARSRAAAISVEQVVAIITSCVLNMSKLEEIIDTLQSRQPLTLRDKITLGTSWAKRETEINNLMLRIRASSRSLNLILTIFNW